MSLYTRALLWLLSREGIDPASRLPPDAQRELALARREAQALANRFAYIDSLAAPILGVTPPPDRGPDDAVNHDAA